jgi:DNA-binding IclR family transcriptional regulator
MKLSMLVGAAIGYVLGARAGRERYEAIVRVARKVAGSQTVQATAGVLHAQVDDMRHRAKELVSEKLHGGGSSVASGVNGHQR